MKKNNILILSLTTLLLSGCDLPSMHISGDRFSYESDDSSTSEKSDHIISDFDGDYIKLYQCEKCKEYVRYPNDGTFDKEFSLHYDASLIEEFENMYKEIKESLTKGTSVNKLKEDKEKLENKAIEIEKVYVCEELRYYVDGNEENEKNENEAYSSYCKSINLLNALDYAICESEYASDIFPDYDIEEYKKALYPYTNEELSTLKSDNDNKGEELYYDYISEGIECYEEIEELVNCRNEYAKKVGYDNYYDYAFVSDYSRTYDASKLEEYRKFIKKYIVDLINKLERKISDSDYYFSFNEYDEIYYDSALNDKDLMNLLESYLKTMKSDTYKVDMYESVNEAYQKGFVLEGSYEDGLDSAFTMVSKSISNNVMYFYDDYYYGSLNTMVHEIGHYNFIDENEDFLDYDLCETHSQSNEIFFLRYLQDSDYFSEKKMKRITNLTLYNLLDTIISFAIYDEIEQCIFNDYSDLNPKLKDGIEANEYELLFDSVCEKYNYDIGSYYSIEYYLCTSPAYEISYSLSLIPVLALYADSLTNLEDAKNCYYKLLTLSNVKEDLESFDYLDLLEYAGYSSPFDEDTFKKIVEKLG